MKIIHLATASLPVTPVIKKTRTIVEQYEVCPHCGEEIREKATSMQTVGGIHYIFHRGPCFDKGPIDSVTDEDAKQAFEKAFPQWKTAKRQQRQPQMPGLQQVLRCPDLRAGDEIHVGRYKNVAVKILGFGVDENNQPTVVSEDGTESKVFNFRIAKILPPGASNVGQLMEDLQQDQQELQDL